MAEEEGQKANGAEGQGDAQRPADAPPATWEEVFQHERFKQLLKRAKEAEAALEAINREKAEAEAAKLKEQARYEELFQREQQKAAKLAEELETLKRNQELERKRQAVLEAARAHEPPFAKEALSDVALFIDLEALQVDDDGKIKGVEAAVKELAKAKPYMLEQKRSDPGSPAGRPATGPARQTERKRITTL